MDSNQVFKTLMGVPPSPPYKGKGFEHGDLQRPRSDPSSMSPPNYPQLQNWQFQDQEQSNAHLNPRASILAPSPHNPRAALPPLDEPHSSKVIAYGQPAKGSPGLEAKEAAAYALNHAAPLPRAHQLEPLAAKWAISAGSSMEDRIMMMEQRLLAAERSSSKASSAYNVQSELVAALANDLRRTTSELNSLQVRFAATAGSGSSSQQQQQQQQQHLEHQLHALHADISAQGAALSSTQRQLAEALQTNTDLRSQVSLLGEELSRAAAHRATADAALDRLSYQVQQGVQSLAADQQRNLGAAEHRQALELSEQRRQAEMQDAAFREEARRRQAQHLAEVAALNREVEQFRAEARAATAALQAAVEQTSMRLRAKEAELDHLQRDTQQQADREAAALGTVSVQLAELQSELASVTHQLRVEQGKRTSEAQAHDASIKKMEAQLAEAQDGIVKRTVAMMETKTAAFNKAMQDLAAVAAERNNDARSSTEAAFNAIVRANNTKERAGMQRVGAIESALVDIAGATAAAMNQLQVKIDTGAAQVSALVESASSSSANREVELREQVNAALARIKKYAEDMEESLEHERMQLEEVVKLEIRGRMKAVEKMRADLEGSSKALDGKLAGAAARLEALEGGQLRHSTQIEQGTEVAKDLRKDVNDLANATVNTKAELDKMKEAHEVQLTWLVSSGNELSSQLKAEGATRQQAHEQLQQLVNQNQAEVQKDLEAHSQQALSLERQIGDNYMETTSRMDELEGLLEASDKAAAEARTAAAAELDKRLDDTRSNAAAQLQEATQQLRDALAADKQELQDAIEASRKETADVLGEESQDREQAVSSVKSELQGAIDAARAAALATSAADKKEVLDMLAADRKAAQEARDAELQARQEAEAVQDEQVAAGIKKHSQDVEDMKDALVVALTGVGIPSVEAALQAGALPQATAFHSKSVINDLTLTKVADRLAALEAYKQQTDEDGSSSAMKQQLSELQGQMSGLLTQQQQLSSLQRQVQPLLQAQTRAAEVEAEVPEMRKQLAELHASVQQLKDVSGTLPEEQQVQLADLQYQLQQIQDRQEEEEGGDNAAVTKQVGGLDERLQMLEAQQEDSMALAQQVKELESTLATQKVDLDAAFRAMQQLEAIQQQESQRMTSELATLQQQMQEVKDINAGTGPVPDKSTRAAPNDEEPADNTAQAQALQASVLDAAARLNQLELWRDKLTTTNALFSDVKELENYVLGRIDLQSQATEDLQKAVQRLMEEARMDAEKDLDKSIESQKYLTMDEASQRFATIAAVDTNTKQIHANHQKAHKNQQVTLQALKAVDQKLTTHAESMAKVLIRTAQQVDALHNALRELESELPATVAVLPTGEAGTAAAGAAKGQTANAAPARPTIKQMDPILKSSGMRDLVARQGALGNESSIDQALKLTALGTDAAAASPSEPGEPVRNLAAHLRLSNISEGDEEQVTPSSQDAHQTASAPLPSIPVDRAADPSGRANEASRDRSSLPTGTGWTLLKQASRRQQMMQAEAEVIRESKMAKDHRLHLDDVLQQPTESIFSSNLLERQRQARGARASDGAQESSSKAETRDARDNVHRSASEPKRRAEPGKPGVINPVSLSSGGYTTRPAPERPLKSVRSMEVSPSLSRSSTSPAKHVASQLRPPPGAIAPGQSKPKPSDQPSKLPGML